MRPTNRVDTYNLHPKHQKCKKLRKKSANNYTGRNFGGTLLQRDRGEPVTQTTRQPNPTTPKDDPAGIAACAQELQQAFQHLLDALSNLDHGPSAIGRRIGVNRVIVSRLLNAVKRSDALEALQQVPGPDSLRAVVDGARDIKSIPSAAIGRASDSVDRFQSLIRDRFGTRSALDAAISDDSATLRQRFEESARYEIYNGMRQVLGVQGETWITAMIFSPPATNAPEDDAIAVTTLHGVIGMRRLRAEAPVVFTFGPPYRSADEAPDPLASPIALQDLYTNAPAPLETEVNNGQLVHRLQPGPLGKDAVADMLAVSHTPKGSRRYAAPDRKLGGAAIFHDVPVRMLHIDTLVHKSLFPGEDPRLIVYNPGSRGPANPNDPARDIDRIDTEATIESLPLDFELIEPSDIPNYAQMLRRVFTEINQPPDDYRVYRLRIAYPLHGFQYVIAFNAPPKP